MHVDVDPLGRNLDEEVHLGAAFLDGGHCVGRLNRMRNRLVADDAAVDVDVLRAPPRPLLGQRRDVAMDAKSAAFPPHLDQLRSRLVDLVEALRDVTRRWAIEQLAAAARQLEADGGRPERQLRHQPRHLGRFGRIGLQELAPRRQVEEQVTHLDRGAFRRPDVMRLTRLTAVDADLDAGQRAARPGAHREVRDRRDAGQCFAAKAERADAVQVRRHADLARGVSVHGQPRIVGCHALAVVLDADEGATAPLDGHRNAARAGVERILDQFLDHRGRPLDDFARRNLIGQCGRQDLDLHLRASPDA